MKIVPEKTKNHHQLGPIGSDSVRSDGPIGSDSVRSDDPIRSHLPRPRQKRDRRGGPRPGSGRPTIHPEGKTTTVWWSIPIAIQVRIAEVAIENSCTDSVQVTNILREWLKDREVE